MVVNDPSTEPILAPQSQDWGRRGDLLRTDFDVIVSGGGPSGSTAARACAFAGLKVLLLDKAEFPRDKPCGGGVTIRCHKLLPFELGHVVERAITSVDFTVSPGPAIVRDGGRILTYLTQRRHLDTFLLEQAERAGTEVRQRTALTDVALEKHSVVVRAGKEAFTARYLVGADGANGPTARLAGFDVARWTGIALEGNVSVDSMPARWEQTIGVDFGHMTSGYGWLFPKGDHVNIGLGGWRGTGPSLRDRLAKLTRFYGFSIDTMWNLRGHPLPVRHPGAAFADGPILLTGDAAGFIDPFTGEGIYAAMWSGGKAAARIVEAVRIDQFDAAALYRDDVRTGLLPDLRVSRKLYDLFHLFPWLWTQGIRFDRIWRLASRLLTGEASYAGASADSPASSGLSLLYESLKLVTHVRRGERDRRALLLFAS